MNNYYIYFLTNKDNTVLYTGCTVNLQKRIYEHKNKFVEGFSKRYNLNKLVYYEVYPSLEEARRREYQLKKFLRRYKEKLINKVNPAWADLYLKL